MHKHRHERVLLKFLSETEVCFGQKSKNAKDHTASTSPAGNEMKWLVLKKYTLHL